MKTLAKSGVCIMLLAWFLGACSHVLPGVSVRGILGKWKKSFSNVDYDPKTGVVDPGVVEVHARFGMSNRYAFAPAGFELDSNSGQIYRTKGDTLFISGPPCEDIEGVYRFEIDGRKMDIELVADECDERKDWGGFGPMWAGRWYRPYYP